MMFIYYHELNWLSVLQLKDCNMYCSITTERAELMSCLVSSIISRIVSEPSTRMRIYVLMLSDTHTTDLFKVYFINSKLDEFYKSSYSP